MFSITNGYNPMSLTAVLPALFQPIQVGMMYLAHRIIMSPMTRCRADRNHVPTDLTVEYYRQRASVPGTLLITEATYISPQASGMPFTPGIWSDEQVKGWKKVTEAVHSKGSYIYLQIWALGRTARPAFLHRESPDYPHVAPSPIPLRKSPRSVPREMTKAEIKQYVKWFAGAATAAVERAGFDGVEIHAANGALVDQFLQDVSNHRTDEYGGSIENRVRFALEVVDAVTAAVGQSRTAIRLSPWSTSQDMRMKDPVPTFSHLVQQLAQRFPSLAYVHEVTPNAHPDLNEGPEDASQANFIQQLWAPRALITTGGYTRQSALEAAEDGQLVGFAQSFLANPDLPFRLKNNLTLNVPDSATFYSQGAKGYTTYPFSPEFLSTRL